MNIPKYLSAEQYAKQSGLGVAEVKKQIKLGNIKALMTEGGYYKIIVYDDCVPKEQYQEAMQKIAKLETQLNAVKSILN